MASDPELSQAVQAFLGQMWQHVDNTIRDILGRHHAQHEPGGKDQVRIPIGFLVDVHAEDAEYADLLYYNEPEKMWVAANLSELPGGGGGTHQVHFSLPLPALVIPPGPCNITQATLTISSVRFDSDDSTVAGTLSAGSGSYAFGPGGFPDRTDGLSDAWADGATMTLSLSNYGSDGTYLSIDVAAG